MTAWRFHNPVDVRFGRGVLAQLDQVLGGRPYALVTYGDTVFAPLIARVAAAAGAPALLIDDVQPNPDFAYLETACARFAELPAPPRAIVALGGGSAIDSAKVMAAAAGDFARVRRFLETGEGADDLAAIPLAPAAR